VLCSSCLAACGHTTAVVPGTGCKPHGVDAAGGKEGTKVRVAAVRARCCSALGGLNQSASGPCCLTLLPQFRTVLFFCHCFASSAATARHTDSGNGAARHGCLPAAVVPGAE
jgi:hypothetical protein